MLKFSGWSCLSSGRRFSCIVRGAANGVGRQRAVRAINFCATKAAYPVDALWWTPALTSVLQPTQIASELTTPGRVTSASGGAGIVRHQSAPRHGYEAMGVNRR